MNGVFTLAQRIKEARLQAGLSQKQLANKLRISDKTISAYELGRAIPPVPTLQGISQITGFSLNNFFETKSPATKQNLEIEDKIDKIIDLLEKINKKL